MTEDKSGGSGERDRAQSPSTPSGGEPGRHIELSEGRKALIVMPTSSGQVDIQNLAPSGPPQAQAAPADAPPPPPSSNQ